MKGCDYVGSGIIFFSFISPFLDIIIDFGKFLDLLNSGALN